MDKKPAISFQGPGQEPELPAQPTPPEQGKEIQPEYITREEAQQMAKSASEEAFRRAQGLFDKGRDGIIKKVREDLAGLQKSLELQRKAGIDVTPEQEERLKNQVISQAWVEEPATPPADQPPLTAPSPGGTPAQAPAPPDGQTLDPVSAEAYAMMQRAGVYIEDDDPELGNIKSNGTIIEFLNSVGQAIEAKRARTVNIAPTNLGATGSYNPNPIAGVVDPHQLWEQAKKQGRV